MNGPITQNEFIKVMLIVDGKYKSISIDTISKPCDEEIYLLMEKMFPEWVKTQTNQYGYHIPELINGCTLLAIYRPI